MTCRRNSLQSPTRGHRSPEIITSVDTKVNNLFGIYFNFKQLLIQKVRSQSLKFRCTIGYTEKRLTLQWRLLVEYLVTSLSRLNKCMNQAVTIKLQRKIDLDSQQSCFLKYKSRSIKPKFPSNNRHKGQNEWDADWPDILSSH